MNDTIATVKELATHANEIKHLQSDMDKLVAEIEDMQATLRSIDKTLSEAKGGWRMLMGVSGSAAAIGAFASWATTHFWK